ncbi:MAG: cell division protein ZapA [Thermoanaerobaculia bacterium]|nr:cell division protein ZapA [Thermoanaerobaculia bacterium]
MSQEEVVTTTEVEIFGATYVLRSGQDREYLAALADEVDRRMCELSEHLEQVDPGRLAILVALNLADELTRNRKHYDGERGEIENRVTELTDRLAEALEG